MSTQLERPGWIAPSLLAAAIFCAYFFVATRSTIWDRDEARFSRATYEMVQSGNYLVPTFGGKLRADKPILIYWLMSVPVKLFGHAEWVYRLCAVLGTVGACCFTFLAGKELFSRRAGLWGMAILGATPLMLMSGAAATSDAVLLAFITASLWMFSRILHHGWTWQRWAALSLIFSGGMLTKGPVALIPGLCSIVASAWIGRSEGASALRTLAAMLASFASFALWFVPANAATGGELLKLQFGHHLMDRISQPLEHHGGYSSGYLVYYFGVIAAAFFPWTLYLPAALAVLFRGLKPSENLETESSEAGVPVSDDAAKFALAWIFTFVLIMIAISTKLPHYILPIWPVLALSVGALFAARPLEREALWNALGTVLFLAGIAALVYVSVFGLEPLIKKDPQWAPFASDTKTFRIVVTALIAVAGLPLAFFNYRAMYRVNGFILLSFAAVALLVASFAIIPAAENLKISADLAKKIRSHYAESVPVALCGYNEPSLWFYLRDCPVSVLGNSKSVRDWSAEPGPGVLVIPRPLLEKYQADTPLPNWRPIEEVKGVNYSTVPKWVDMLVIQREQ